MFIYLCECCYRASCVIIYVSTMYTCSLVHIEFHLLEYPIQTPRSYNRLCPYPVQLPLIEPLLWPVNNLIFAVTPGDKTANHAVNNKHAPASYDLLGV